MALKLPRLQSTFPIVTDKGKASNPFQRWWQSVVEAIETAFAGLAENVSAIALAQTAADAAQTDVDSQATPSYLTLTNTAILTNERRLVGGTGVAITDGGAGGAATIQIDTVTDLGYTPANKAGDTFGGPINVPDLRITSGGGAPTLSTDTGVAGQIAWDATHIYVCVAPNTWVRAPTATF